MKKILTMILCVSLTLCLAAPAMASWEGGYDVNDETPPDLPVSNPIDSEPDATPVNWKGYFFLDCATYPAVEEAAALGLVHGYGDGTFRPLNTVTRGEWYQMLYNAFGSTPHYDVCAQEHADVEWMIDTLGLMLGHAPSVADFNWRQISSGDFVARYEAVQLLLSAIS